MVCEKEKAYLSIIRDKALILKGWLSTMAELPWNIDIMIWFVNHRIDWLTTIFQVLTFFGSEQGYILLIITLYWIHNKRAAIFIVLSVLLSAYINHILKIIIRNPRPFVTDGTYEENWAIPEGDVQGTVDSFSTPSGHAQSSSTFWWSLHLKLKTRPTFVLMPVMILGVGISRVYLGVHYLEDVILGWIIGFLVVVFAMRYGESIGERWNALSDTTKYILAIGLPTLLWVPAGILSNYSPDGENFATFGGMMTGILVGLILETDLNFNPSLEEYSGYIEKLLIAMGRIIIGLVLVAFCLFGLDIIFGLITGDDSMIGFFFRYIRYTFVAFSGIYLAPLLFKKLRLAS